MTEAEYRAIPALSFSSMKDLEVSSYRFWYLHVNPERPEPKPSPEMIFGNALHCAILHPPEVFDAQYAQPIDDALLDNALDTIGDLREWLTDKGFKPKGTRKEALIQQVLSVDPQQPIAQVIQARYSTQNQGKTILRTEDWSRLVGCVESLKSEPAINRILSAGQPEVPLFHKDAETGAPLKCRLDWMHPDLTFDLKTFAAKRRKSIDENVTDAIWYEGYLQQGLFYTGIRHANELVAYKPFVFAFVESDPPHEVRIKQFHYNKDYLYFNQTALKVRALIDRYAYCMETYGEGVWRDAQEITNLQDEEFRQLGWA